MLGHVHHDAREAHAPGRCPEQFGVRCRGNLLPSPGGGHDREGNDGIAPGPNLVVVLAVHIRGNGPPDGDLPGAGRDRYEPAERHQPADERVDGGARVRGHHARFEVQVVDARDGSCVDHHPARVLGRVSVGTAQPAGDQATGPNAVQRPCQLVRVHGLDDG